MIHYRIGDIVEITTHQDGYDKIIHGYDRRTKCEVVALHPVLKVRRMNKKLWRPEQQVEHTDVKPITTPATQTAAWKARNLLSTFKEPTN